MIGHVSTIQNLGNFGIHVTPLPLSHRALSYKSSMVNSSILVYHFLQHALLFCSTWMPSFVHLKKRGVRHLGLVFRLKDGE